MLILPVSPHLISEILDDLPIRLAVLERFKDLIEALNPPLRTGESTFLFQAGRSRQHNVGVAAGITEENVLNDKELELPSMDRLDHLMVVQSFRRRKFCFPG